MGGVIRRIGWATLAIIVILSACSDDEAGEIGASIRDDEEAQILVSIDPIQCLGNPWEQDWLLTHEYAEYPKDQESQLRIFREFFEQQGVSFHNIEVTSPYKILCYDCSCPNGDRIICLIDEVDLTTLLGWGFVEAG